MTGAVLGAQPGRAGRSEVRASGWSLGRPMRCSQSARAPESVCSVVMRNPSRWWWIGGGGASRRGTWPSTGGRRGAAGWPRRPPGRAVKSRTRVAPGPSGRRSSEPPSARSTSAVASTMRPSGTSSPIGSIQALRAGTSTGRPPNSLAPSSVNVLEPGCPETFMTCRSRSPSRVAVVVASRPGTEDSKSRPGRTPSRSSTPVKNSRWEGSSAATTVARPAPTGTSTAHGLPSETSSKRGVPCDACSGCSQPTRVSEPSRGASGALTTEGKQLGPPQRGSSPRIPSASAEHAARPALEVALGNPAEQHQPSAGQQVVDQVAAARARRGPGRRRAPRPGRSAGAGLEVDAGEPEAAEQQRAGQRLALAGAAVRRRGRRRPRSSPR